MTSPAPPLSAASLSRPRRSVLVLGALAAVIALWLGLAAPAVSPVSPPLPGVGAGVVLQVDDDGGAVDDDGPRAGRGRR